MRVLFRKFHCPSFICFCKPSAHLLSPCQLKIENTPHVPSTLSSVSDSVVRLSGETIEVKKESFDGKPEVENYLKSILKQPSSEPDALKEVDKRRVQWMDFVGKELVDIKEFEPRWAQSLLLSSYYFLFLSLFFNFLLLDINLLHKIIIGPDKVNLKIRMMKVRVTEAVFVLFSDLPFICKSSTCYSLQHGEEMNYYSYSIGLHVLVLFSRSQLCSLHLMGLDIKSSIARCLH
ncbi:hypothetical protein HHK36_017516 [Tetracentron sinense]|uniref:Uncharacterized protein n=1 Tax=Tetracentron sinense TaxID=13715 RepID=A0A834Z1E4_TETSI|nr:hypothetical protein HHK36_017516 [Tetracentron sinense]